MTNKNWLQQIGRALTLPEYDWQSARLQMGVGQRNWHRPISRPGTPRIGAVLCLFYPSDHKPNQLHVVLTKRPDTLKDHPGQVSFPGGRVEEGEALDAAALRELEEELGVPSTGITLLGTLASLYIQPSDFLVHPFIGFTPKRPVYAPNRDEVSHILEPTVSHLMHPTTRKITQRHFENRTFDVPYFDVEGFSVWGATAIMLSEWIGRWHTLGIAST